MIIVPAIDLLDGKAVRLEQGRYDKVTIYDEAPAARARAFEAAGARRLHVVDLDGARQGAPAQRAVVAELVRAVKIPVQVGGGLRTAADALSLLDTGAEAVVMGTSAIRDPALVEHACRSLPGRVIVAIDARGGKVAIEGWIETSEVLAEELAARVGGWGAAAILYTDILRDGMRVGPNVEATRQVASVSRCPVYASGGVGRIDELLALAAVEPKLEGAIVGRALYSGAFTLEDAIAALAKVSC